MTQTSSWIIGIAAVAFLGYVALSNDYDKTRITQGFEAKSKTTSAVVRTDKTRVDYSNFIPGFAPKHSVMHDFKTDETGVSVAKSKYAGSAKYNHKKNTVEAKLAVNRPKETLEHRIAHDFDKNKSVAQFETGKNTALTVNNSYSNGRNTSTVRWGSKNFGIGFGANSGDDGIHMMHFKLYSPFGEHMLYSRT
jgi:hypothetical protein